VSDCDHAITCAERCGSPEPQPTPKVSRRMHRGRHDHDCELGSWRVPLCRAALLTTAAGLLGTAYSPAAQYGNRKPHSEKRSVTSVGYQVGQNESGERRTHQTGAYQGPICFLSCRSTLCLRGIKVGAKQLTNETQLHLLLLLRREVRLLRVVHASIMIS